MLTISNAIIILIFAFIGWILCFAVIGIGRKVTTMDKTLIAHAIAAPLIFVGLSLIYFTFFNYTSPLETALIFTAFIIIMDFIVGALELQRFSMIVEPFLEVIEVQEVISFEDAQKNIQAVVEAMKRMPK